jgi:hypothetical protein
MGGSRKATTSATTARSVFAPSAHANEPVDPAFHRAILKIALELKKPSARGYDAIVPKAWTGRGSRWRARSSR